MDPDNGKLREDFLSAQFRKMMNILCNEREEVSFDGCFSALSRPLVT